MRPPASTNSRAAYMAGIAYWAESATIRSRWVVKKFSPQLDRHKDALRKSVARHSLDLGLRHFTRKDLEAVEAAGETLHIQVLGLASIADDVSPELARRTIASIHVLGALHASPAVKEALTDRVR